jgi:hypothetical protein
MGNRAVITASTKRTGAVGIYLHWNGGIESVLAFCHAARDRGYRDPSADDSYAMARLCGLIHEFFGVYESTSLGIGCIEHLDTDNYDNGTFVIGKDWNITDRWGKGSTDVMTLDQFTPQQLNHYTAIIDFLKQTPQQQAA